ncbi:MAG TPA: triose-phosphate isomerase [Nitrospirota bacterium]
MQRKPVIAGNWKMHMTIPEALELVGELKATCSGRTDVEVIVAPPFTALLVTRISLENTGIGLAAQNIHFEPKGAFTGEVSGPMLKDAGCTHVIIGHSERRQYFCETDESVNKKVFAALSYDIVPIVCVGETLQQREAGDAFKVIETQLAGGLRDLSAEQAAGIILAYEPVWAIGTGKTATPEQAQEVHAFIRSWLTGRFGSDCAAKIRIQYGGSVKPDNVAELMAKEDIDGALVGGAALKADSFTALVNFKG